MAQRTRQTQLYQTVLIQALRNPEEAAAYLSAAFEEHAEDLFLLALCNVAEAYGIAKLRTRNTPRLATIRALLDALGLRLAVEVKAA